MAGSSKKKVYCGIGKVPKTHRVGNMKECAELKQIRRYGAHKIDSKLLNAINNPKNRNSKNDRKAVITKMMLLRGRVNKITKDNKVFVKYTLIMAITNKGVLDWILYEKGGSDHCRFIEFLKRFLVNRKKKLILMDNASCHRNQLVKNYIIQSGNDYLHILPYCHYLNPIEKLFNQLKHYMKKDEPMSYNLIKVSINKSIKNIKLKTFENYFKSSLIKTKDDIIKNKTKYIKKPKIYKS